MKHPLDLFQYCPECGSSHFEVNNEKSKKCTDCGFVYYFNPSSATVALILNDQNELLVCRRAKEPAKGTLDLPGGFIDMKTVNNPHPEAGISGSIRLGVEKLIELEEKCGKTGSRKREGCMFAVADQPYLTRESLENMVETWEVSKKGILVSENAGRMGNPVIFAYKYYEELKNLEGDVGGKGKCSQRAGCAAWRPGVPEWSGIRKQ